MTTYTIDRIQDEMRADGSHWWDAATMRHFQCRVGSQVYQGPGGVYFVTSERPPGGKREFSVRQYRPESKDIKTIGDFCSMTRSVAHAEAARLAGEGAIVAQEAHTPITEAEDFASTMHREAAIPRGACDKLRELARRHHRLQEEYCNGVFDTDEWARRDERIEARIIALLAPYDVTPKFGGDPRGCTVKLQVPSGKTDDWGAEGICVPIDR